MGKPLHTFREPPWDTAVTRARPEIQVRRLVPGDYEPWRSLWTRYLEFYQSTQPEEVYEANWTRLLDDREPTAGFLALVDARPAGLVHALTHRSFWTIGDYCYLQDLYVDGPHRSIGIGRTLIEAVRTYAHDRGCSRVYWLTHETNKTAIQLYDTLAEKPGFIQYVMRTER